jgi:tetratricopeptide (TPR) repeat protein
MGGIGKTELAKVLAHELRDLYPDAQILVALKGAHQRGEQALSASDALAHVVRSFHPDAKLPEKQEELRALYYSVLEGKRAFLLLDNALDAAQIAPLLPPPPGCAVVVTSRRSFSVPGLEPLNLDTLDPEEARALLLRIAPRIRGHEEEIAQFCGCLPLALCLAAGALAARENLAPGDYVRQLRAGKARLAALDRYRGATEQELGVEASLDMSYEWLGEDLRKLWRALAVFPGTFDAAGAAAVWGTSPGEAEERLGDLLACHTVQWNKDTGRYSLHDLARDYAAAKLSGEERAEVEWRHAAYYCLVLSLAGSLYKEGGGKILLGLTLFDREWESIRAGQAWATVHAGDDEVVARLSVKYPDTGAYCLDLRLHPSERIVWLESSLAAARKLGDRGGEGAALGNLGVAYKNLGDPRRAIEFYEQSLAIHREIGYQCGEGITLGNLGNAYFRLGDPRRAIEFHEQALAIAREMGDRRGESNAIGNLGNAYASIGETHRAIEFYEQSLAIDREIGDRRGEGAVLGCLGNAHLFLGDLRRAIEYYEQSLAIAREIGDRRVEGVALGNLGVAYADLGDPRRAIEFSEQYFTIAREIGDRRGEGTALWSRSVALDKLGQRDEAIASARDALAIFEQIEDPTAAKVRKQLQDWGALPR